jgi:hypothetical protein
MSSRLPFKDGLKPFFHKPLPQFLDPPTVHPCPVGGHLIGIPSISEQQCLCPFAFLGAVFPFVDNFVQRLLFIFGERYLVFLLWIDPLPFDFYAGNYKTI